MVWAQDCMHTYIAYAYTHTHTHTWVNVIITGLYAYIHNTYIHTYIPASMLWAQDLNLSGQRPTATSSGCSSARSQDNTTVCMCVCVYVCMRVFVYVCMCIPRRTWTCMHTTHKHKRTRLYSHRASINLCDMHRHTHIQNKNLITSSKYPESNPTGRVAKKRGALLSAMKAPSLPSLCMNPWY